MEERTDARMNIGAAADVRFGPFELDVRAHELRREGRTVRLQEQPFHILRMLLERQGEIVLREEIRKQLWPNGVMVEFDQGINAAVKRLRDALRDSADKPRYIETIPRLGYRFVCTVEALDCAPAGPHDAAVAPAPIAITDRAIQKPTDALRARSGRLWTGVAALAIVISLIVWRAMLPPRAAGAAAGSASRRERLQPLVRLDVDLGNDVSLGLTANANRFGGADMILSPDGTRIVYVSQSRLFSKRLDEQKAIELPGTEQAYAPFFSPDGQWVAFFANGKLKKVAMRGGPPVDLCDAPLASGGAWGEDGDIIAALDINGLARIPSAGGVPTPVTGLAPGEITHRWPHLIPGARAILFTAFTSMSGLEGATVEAMSLTDHERKTILRGGIWAHYMPTGHLIYINNGKLFAVAFDLSRFEVHGTPTPILEDVAYSAAWGSAQLDLTRTGTLIYRSSRAGAGLVSIQWLDESGNARPLVPVPGNYLSPTLSPDGSRLALNSAGDIWVYEFGRGTMTRLTVGGGYGNPVWTADGLYIVFRAARAILWTRADGTTTPQFLTQSKTQQSPWSFTGNGKRLAFVDVDPVTGADIWTVPIETDGSGLRAGKPEVFLRTAADERAPMFSPDGRWLAYMSNKSGAYRVYVETFPRRAAERQISTEQSGYPAWSQNTDELFFWQVGVENQLMVASYKVRGDLFVPDKPRVWSNKIVGFRSTKSYDPAADGRHIVALVPADTAGEEKSPHHVIFVLNFLDELRRREVTVGKLSQ